MNCLFIGGPLDRTHQHVEIQHYGVPCVPVSVHKGYWRRRYIHKGQVLFYFAHPDMNKCDAEEIFFNTLGKECSYN